MTAGTGVRGGGDVVSDDVGVGIGRDRDRVGRMRDGGGGGNIGTGEKGSAFIGEWRSHERG